MKAILTNGIQQRMVFNSTKSINPWDPDDSPEAWVGTGQQIAKLVTLVPAVQLAWQTRCKAMADLPFCIYGKGDKEIDNSDSYKNAVGFMPNPRHFLWLTEAALVGYGRAYWLKGSNRYKVVKELKYFMPTSIVPKLNEQVGLAGFERHNGAATIQYKPEEILYFWLADPAVEIGPPTTYPLAAALQCANALGMINKFINDYMERGAVKAMLLAAKGMPDKNEAERVEKWWNKFMSGAKSLTWKLFNAEAITPTIVGEGLEAFKGVQIISDLTEQIYTAMGTRHLLEDENYATANVRQREFYSNTVMPEARAISDALNEQILQAMGYHLEFEPERLEVFQDDEAANATALGTLTNALTATAPDVIELAMSILGYELTEDQQAMLDEIKAKREQAKEEIDEQTEGNGTSDNPVTKGWVTINGNHVLIGENDEFNQKANDVIDKLPSFLSRKLNIPNGLAQIALHQPDYRDAIGSDAIRFFEDHPNGETNKYKWETRNIDQLRNVNIWRLSENIPVSGKDWLQDLEKWKRKAVKRVGKDVDFVSETIPAELQARIHALLPDCKCADDVRMVFNIKDEPIEVTTEFKQLPDFSSVIKGLRIALDSYKSEIDGKKEPGAKQPTINVTVHNHPGKPLRATKEGDSND